MIAFPQSLSTLLAQADRAGEVDVSVATVWETVDNMVDGFMDRLPFLLIGIVVFVLFYFIAKIARGIVKRTTEGRISANLGRVIGRLTPWLLIFIGLLIAVTIMAPSVTPTKLLASLGVGGVAVGFAFKDILQNFMAGLLLLVNEPFCVGDRTSQREGWPAGSNPPKPRPLGRSDSEAQPCGESNGHAG